MEYLHGPPAACSPDRCRREWCGPVPPQKPDAKVFAEFAAGSGAQSVSTTMALRPPAAEPGPRPRRSARWSPRSSPTRPGPSAWSHSSRRPRSTRPTASATCRSTPTSRCTTPRAPRARSSRRGSPRPVPWRRSRRWPRPTPPGASPWSRCSSSIRCSGSSGWATSPGRSATCAAAASWPGARPGAPPSRARGSSTTTASRRCSPRPTRPPWSTTPAFAYEVAIIVEAAVTEMLGPDPEDRFWYLTLYNENYPMPALPEGREGGGHPSAASSRGSIATPRRPMSPATCAASLCFSGPMWSVALEAQHLLAEHYGVGVDTWAVTSWTSLRTDALEVERWNRLHPGDEPRRAKDHAGSSARALTPSSPSPTTCAACPTRWRGSWTAPSPPSGTDGFGRSDARGALRSYFEVDAAASGGRGAPAAGPERSRRPRHRDRRDRRLRDRPDTGGTVHGVSRATKDAIASSAPSGTRSVSARWSARMSMATSKKPQHCFSL